MGQDQTRKTDDKEGQGKKKKHACKGQTPARDKALQRPVTQNGCKGQRILLLKGKGGCADRWLQANPRSNPAKNGNDPIRGLGEGLLTLYFLLAKGAKRICPGNSL